MKAWQRDSLICLGLFLLPLGVFFREAVGQFAYFHRDLQLYFYPYHKAVTDLVAQGGWPLWNPYAFSGMPLLGDGQTAMLYPPNWLFWVLPAAHALTLSILLHLSIAGVGMYLYMRALRLSALAALIAALAFEFNGFLVARFVHPSIMAGAALVPLVFWGIELILQRGTRGAFAIAAVVFTLQVLVGHPQVPLYTALAVGLYVLVIVAWRWRHTGQRGALLPLAQVAGAYGVGIMLAAVQLLPWAELASFSPRAANASYALVTHGSLIGFDWLLFLFPYAFGGLRPSPLVPFVQAEYPVGLWEKHGYVGILPLALAVVGLVHVLSLPHAARTADGQPGDARFRAERGVALAAVLGVFLLIALGRGTPFAWLIYYTPVLGKLRGYSRAVCIADFALCALAGYGVQRLGDITGRKRDWAPIVAGLSLLGVALGAIVVNAEAWSRNVERYAPTSLERTMLTQGLRFDQATAFIPLALIAAAALLLLALSRGMTPLTAGMLVYLVTVDLMTFAAFFNPAIPTSTFATVPASAAFLKRDPSLYRVAVFALSEQPPLERLQAQLAFGWTMPYGVEDINGFNSLQPRRYTDVLFGTQVDDVSYGYLGDPNLFRDDNPILNLLNVKYAVVQPEAHVTPPEQWQRVFADSDVAIYQNPSPLDRAFFTDRVLVQSAPQTVLENVTRQGFRPQDVAYVEGGLDQAAADRLASSTPAEVRIQRVSPTQLRLTTRTTADRFLVLSEMWFPGWQAELIRPDGQTSSLPIYRTDYLLRGLVVPAGENTVRVFYRPLSVVGGAALSMLTALGLVALVLAPRTRKRFRGE